MHTYRSFISLAIVIGIVAFASPLMAATGLAEVKASNGSSITLFYPSNDQVKKVQRGPYVLDAAWEGMPKRGNGRLIVISHGSGGAPWVHTDLATTLVQAGFVVALPEHAGDNYKDQKNIGLESWKIRPQEISRAIDSVKMDSRVGPLISTDRVGIFGVSAGGHTALTLAGGKWSPRLIREHCENHMDEDYYACGGMLMPLQGNMIDWGRRLAVKAMLNGLNDTNSYSYTDPRIVVAVAAVPPSVDFDSASLASIKIPVGIITAREDKWVNPNFHSMRVIKTCMNCKQIVDLKNGGHGSMLSPLPPANLHPLGKLLSDPPGFNRPTEIPALNNAITVFLQKYLS